jgi:anaerobic ribonucleoside-triphosphate reductase activating protein
MNLDNLIPKLNVAEEMPRSVVNGPGDRYVIWVQGCSLRCPGCFNEVYQPLIEKNMVEVDSLAAKIISSKGIEGVTYSGGEPMLQSRALYQLSTILKENGLTIMCYSGYTLKELRQKEDPYTNKLLGVLDILVDGPYILEQKQNLLWRGSSNQKVHFLSEIYTRYKPVVMRNMAEMEISISRDRLVLTGMLQEKIIEKLNQRLGSINQ